jgi:hypothetical protein
MVAVEEDLQVAVRQIFEQIPLGESWWQVEEAEVSQITRVVGLAVVVTVGKWEETGRSLLAFLGVDKEPRNHALVEQNVIAISEVRAVYLA